MNDREIMQQALDALKQSSTKAPFGADGVVYVEGVKIHEAAITALRERLAQPEQEPVAWMTPDGEGFRIRFSPPVNDVPLGWDALYTSPPQRTWVGLTIEEIAGCCMESTTTQLSFAKNLEAKLKEHNT